jgi:hypothetical protein
MTHRTLLATLLVSLVFACPPPALAEDAHEWSVRYMLVNGTDDASLVGATTQVASHSKLRTPEMRELLAEILGEINAGKTVAPEAAVDIIRVLAVAPDAQRYHSVIRGARKLSHEGMTQAQNAYSKRFPRAKGEQWAPGTMDLATARREAIESALAARPTPEQTAALRSLPDTASLDDLFARVGKPAHVRPRDTRSAQNHANMDIRQIAYFYRGIGRIVFDYRHETGWRPDNRTMDPLAFEGLMPYRKDAAARGLPDDTAVAMTQLLNGSAPTMRMSAIAIHGLDSAPPEYLDAAAELLLRGYATAEDPELVDAYAWLCNVLAHHGGNRYLGVLATILKRSDDGKLRRYAGQPVRNRNDGAPRYTPGSVSLDELARKYPSPYPDFTAGKNDLTNGR